MKKLKIGLYLQDITVKGNQELNFYEAMESVKKSDIDLLVFPENYYYPFAKYVEGTSIVDKECLKKLISDTLKPFAKELNCAIIICGKDKSSGEETFIYSLFVNPYEDDESKCFKLYIKHTACNKSAFDLDEYNIDEMFSPMPYKGFMIGQTICYDSNFPIFSRSYAVRGANVLINSTGGNVDYKKWARYQKTRAIENNCFSLCTMAQNDKTRKNTSYTYAYDRHGCKMRQDLVFKSKISNEDSITSVLLDIESDCKFLTKDKELDQADSLNKKVDFELSRAYLQEILSDKLFQIEVIKTTKHSLMLIKLRGHSILYPEMIHSLMDSKTMDSKVIIVNQWDELDTKEFDAKFSIVAKTRCVEFMCPVVVVSKDIFVCYQPGMNKTVQSLKIVNQFFGIDLGRANGFESVREISGNKRKRKMYQELIANVLDKLKSSQAKS